MDVVKSSVRKAVMFARLANSYQGNPNIRLTWEALAEGWSKLAAKEHQLSADARETEAKRLGLIEAETLKLLGVRALAPNI